MEKQLTRCWGENTFENAAPVLGWQICDRHVTGVMCTTHHGPPSAPALSICPRQAFKVFLRKSGEEPLGVSVTPATTIAEIKSQMDLRGHAFCFKGNRKDAETMESVGLAAGDTISVIKTSPSAAYTARARLKRGETKRSAAHAHLNIEQPSKRRKTSAVPAHLDPAARVFEEILAWVFRGYEVLEEETPVRETVFFRCP